MPFPLGAAAATLGTLFGGGLRAGGAGIRGAIAAGARTGMSVISRPAVQATLPIAAGAVGGYYGSRASAGPSNGFPRRRRGKGITAAELRGARKIANLVRMYGMRPKTGRVAGRKRCR